MSIVCSLDSSFGEFAGTPCDALEQVEILTKRQPELEVVDRVPRGYDVDKTQVLIRGSRHGLPPAQAADLRRRAAIEPEIGHMKTDGSLARAR